MSLCPGTRGVYCGQPEALVSTDTDGGVWVRRFGCPAGHSRSEVSRVDGTALSSAEPTGGRGRARVGCYFCWHSTDGLCAKHGGLSTKEKRRDRVSRYQRRMTERRASLLKRGLDTNSSLHARVAAMK